jgi:phage tail sheath gpL-like
LTVAAADAAHVDLRGAARNAGAVAAAVATADVALVVPRRTIADAVAIEACAAIATANVAAIEHKAWPLDQLQTRVGERVLTNTIISK